MDSSLLVVAGLALGLGVLIFRIVEYRSWDQGCSLEDFQKAHPRSFAHGKFLACPYCQGTVLRVLKYRKGALRKKICRSCNRELWREKE